MQLLILFKVTTEGPSLHEVLSYNSEVECHYFGWLFKFWSFYFLGDVKGGVGM